MNSPKGSTPASQHERSLHRPEQHPAPEPGQGEWEEWERSKRSVPPGKTEPEDADAPGDAGTAETAGAADAPAVEEAAENAAPDAGADTASDAGATGPVPEADAGPGDGIDSGAETDPPPAAAGGATGAREGGVSAAFDKRESDRIQKVHAVRLHGRHGSYRALVVNVSRTGALALVTDPRFGPSEEQLELGYAGLRVASHFGDVFEIEFVDAGFLCAAEMARITAHRHQERSVVSIGCRFLEELPDDRRAALGVPQEGQPAHQEDLDPAAVAAAAAEATALLAHADLPAVRRRLRPHHARATIRVSAHGRELTLRDLLELAVERDASDVHVQTGSPVRLRVHSNLAPLGDHLLTDHEAETLVRSMLTDEQLDRFEQENDLDIGYSIEGVARFRVNVLRSRAGTGMAIRRIPENVPTIAQLGLSPVCARLADRPRGLVLVTGPTGSGKSTTLAAMIHHINLTRACHIVTMEDPIEYIHREAEAHITQREVGRHTQDFAAALKRALRQDPDVLLVGEMRDLETMALAVTAAETGHLVFATLHTTSAVLTVDRIVDVFPSTQQRQIRMQLADALQGIFCQMLLPRRGGGVVVAQEILTATPGIRALIREGKTPQIGNMMQTGAKEGMQTLEDALNDLIARGLLQYETALAKANHPQLIKREGKALARPPA